MLLATLLAYGLGSLSPAYLVTRARLRRDIRALGSGNAGALNVAREVGPQWGLLVLLLDAAKGAGAVGIAHILGDTPTSLFAASLGLIIGHNWPVALGFRGGKGVAPVFGISLALLPGLTLVALVLTIVAFAATRSAVAAFGAGLTMLNLLTVFTGQPPAQVALCFLLTSIVTATHLYAVRRQLLAAIRVRRWLDFFAME